ncbi:MAG TPA: prepilin-type N-terminal cleavage/methylation domain-containing protein [Candidatus Limnocylindria bacterium]|jgi:prepilin-type N-terminal cleavage/methylation domain-containing protein|nr:prepilin-type N-terminal cleavage/methylation domain-containing protein [Candidatus Limnocylindria bacterium]HTL66196.1 prepilin-type N-terminal cleavage/methylation domain-containing protein [Lacunisphaera sp.]
MKIRKRFHSAQGFSLLELVMVLAIISVLVGLLLPKGFDALRNARVQEVKNAVKTLKTALTDLIAMPGGNGSIPRTEGTGIPCTGVALSGATDVAKGNGARLDAVLVALGKLDQPLTLRMGSQVYTSSGSGNEMTWNQATQSFVITPDAAPLRNWSAVTRVEARASSPGTLPSVALGANFRLDGITDRSANVTIAYLVITGVPAKDAYQLALSMNPPALAPVEGAACDAGMIAYAAPVNGVTDVYCYLAEL